MKKRVAELLKNHIEGDFDIESLLEKPKAEAHGDMAFPCFVLAKELKKSPQEISKELESEISENLPGFLSEVKAIGPFLNFFYNNKIRAEEVFEKVFSEYGVQWESEDKQRIVIEYPSPNTNKALHVGHVRNLLLGNCLRNLLRKKGDEVIVSSMYNDRGIAICKAMLSYQMFGEGKTPESDGKRPDKFVAEFYELFSRKNKERPDLELDKKAQEMLVQWENGNKEVLDLWRKLMRWVFEGYSETYKRFGYGSDKDYYESEIYKEGKDIVKRALNDGVKGFKKDETGAVYVDLEEEGLGKKYLLRGDGTTLYMTQDLYLASLKENEFSPDKSVFIVSTDQKYHFEVLFEILSRLSLGGVEKNYHFPFGVVFDKDGNEFSSRKGNVIYGDDLLDLMENKAYGILKEKNTGVSEGEMQRRSRIIGYGALAFNMLKINSLADINFDVDEASSFEGETGPYVQYTYARIKSVLSKGGFKGFSKATVDYNLYNDVEVSIIRHMEDFEEKIREAVNKYKPSVLAHFVLRLCQKFNDYYQKYSINNAEEEEVQKARLELAAGVAEVIRESLRILDIDVLEEM